MPETPEVAKAPSGANSPYKIKKQGGKWCVVNNIGETKGSFPGNDAGYQRALKYQRALYVNVPGAPGRAAKVKFSGKARNRVPVQKSEQAQRITADLSAVAAMPKHGFVPSSTDPTGGTCTSCGQPSVNPVHDDWTEGQQDAVSELLDEEQSEAAAYTGGGCMVALYLDPAEASKFAGTGTEDAKDMHITLAYMKDTPAGPELDRLKAVVEGVAHTAGPLQGTWGGTGQFNPSKGSDGKPVSVALPDLPGLPPLRERLVQALDAAGFPVSKDHGYTPHMTIAYDDKQSPKAAGELDFDQISLAIGDTRFDYPLTSTEKAALLPLGLTLPVEEAHDTKVKHHRYVGAHHVRDTVVSTAGFFGGCYACGATQGVGDHSGSCADPGSAGTAPGGGSTPAEGAAVGVEEALSIPNTIAALDAVIDQIMVLLRSTPTEDLPPYAQQAKDLLGAADLAIDGLMSFLNIPDPDDDEGPDKNDAGPEASKLSEADQASVDAESERIKENKKLPAASAPHKFRPARWTHPNGHPRCIVCGDEESMGDCPGIDKEAAAFEEVMTSDAVTRERMATVADVPAGLPAVKAFLSEINGRTLITAPASTFHPEWEKALTPNENFLWVQGKFVGAEEANRNGAFWSNRDLEMGEPTVKHGPLNWLHEDRHIIGSIADAKLVVPTQEAAAAGQGNHIAAVAAVWSWLYPDESFVIESASDARSLFYSMECISKEVACEGPGGCGMVVPYRQMVQFPEKSCQHIRERSATRHFIDPTFLGGAIIVPPVRPGWADANAEVMRQAASLAERAFDDAGQPDIPAGEWERLMAEVVLYANRS